MIRSRLGFRLRTMLVVVALCALVFVHFVRPPQPPRRIVHLLGTVTLEPDGTAEIVGGRVQMDDAQGTEVKGDRIVLSPDGSLSVFGKGSLRLAKPPGA